MPFSKIYFSETIDTQAAPVFALPSYLKWHHETTPGVSRWGYLQAVSSDGRTLTLPFIEKRKLIFRYWQFPTATWGVSVSIEDEQIFLDAVVDFAHQEGIDFIIQPTNNALFRAVPKGAKNCAFGSYRVDLTQSEEALWAALHSKHRNAIRFAQRENSEIRRGTSELTAAVSLIQRTHLRAGMGCPDQQVFSKLLSSVGANVEVFTAWKGSECQGAAIIPYSHEAAYYLYGGSADKPVQGAMNLLHWEALRFFKGRGVLVYDFVGARINPRSGSKQETLQRFKSRFGGPLVEGYLWKFPINPIKYEAYKFSLRLNALLKRSAFKGDIIDQEQSFGP